MLLRLKLVSQIANATASQTGISGICFHRIRCRRPWIPIIQVIAIRSSRYAAQIAQRDRRRGMNRHRRERPRQSLGQQQPEMSPWPHVPHHHDPAQALVQQFAEIDP